MSVAADRREVELREHASLVVRAGLGTPDEQVAELAEVVRAQMPHTDATVLARAWWVAARREHERRSGSWPAPTDHDRFVAAVEECRAHDVLVLLGADEQQARTSLAAAQGPVRGVLWCSAQQVHGAVAAGVLDLQLWHPTGEPVASVDALTGAVLSCFDRHGLPARWHDHRPQVATWWRRRG